MALNYVTITETFDDGTGSPIASGVVTFTPSSAVYAGSVPVATPSAPIQAQIVAGALKSPSGGTLQLLATDNTVTTEGLTGFWYWTVNVNIGGATQTFSFFLPHSPSTVDLYSLANTGAGGGGGGGVASVTAADTSIVVGGTGTNPTVATGTLDVIAADHPPAANWSNNSHKITSLANGSGAQDAAAFGQVLPVAGGAMAGELSPAVVALTDAATILVNAALGNDFRVTLGGNRTMGAPSNPTDGQTIVFAITQPSSAGPDTITWTSTSGGYSFGTAGAPTLTTANSKTDLVGFKYDAAKTAWLYTGSSLGF